MSSKYRSRIKRGGGTGGKYWESQREWREYIKKSKKTKQQKKLRGGGVAESLAVKRVVEKAPEVLRQVQRTG